MARTKQTGRKSTGVRRRRSLSAPKLPASRLPWLIPRTRRSNIGSCWALLRCVRSTRIKCQRTFGSESYLFRGSSVRSHRDSAAISVSNRQPSRPCRRHPMQTSSRFRRHKLVRSPGKQSHDHGARCPTRTAHPRLAQLKFVSFDWRKSWNWTSVSINRWDLRNRRSKLGSQVIHRHLAPRVQECASEKWPDFKLRTTVSLADDLP
jgi:hypothetical protein